MNDSRPEVATSNPFSSAHLPTSKEGKIWQAMGAVMTKIGAIGKAQRNDTQKFNYRGIDDVYNEMHQAFEEAKIFCAPRTVMRSEKGIQKSSGTIWNRVVLETIFRFYSSEDGSFVDVGPIFSEGEDGGDKASMKAIAHAHKYALLQAFFVPTKEEKDPDASTPPNTEGQRKPQGNQQSKGQSSQRSAPANNSKPAGQKQNAAKIDKKMQGFLVNEAAKKNISTDNMKEILKGFYNIEKSGDLKVFQFEELVKMIQTKTLDQIGQEMVSRLAEQEMAKGK